LKQTINLRKRHGQHCRIDPMLGSLGIHQRDGKSIETWGGECHSEVAWIDLGDGGRSRPVDVKL